MTRGTRFSVGIVLALLVTGLVVLAAGGFTHWRDTRYPNREALEQAALPAGDDLIARGQYLARAADCIACHTVDGGEPYAGGVSFATPFGTLYAPNITPDPETGIGDWSDADFVRAMHRGVGKDGKRLYPAFPYPYYTLMSTEEVLAIKAYLFSLPPVRNEITENELSFPFNLRFLLSFWNLLFHDDGRFQPDPQQDEVWNRGAYLVQGPGHCGACHTARNVLQAPSGPTLAGETTDGWRAYNITQDPNSGIGNWSDAELLQYLQTGIAGERAFASGPMADVIEYSTRHLTAEDLQAMVTYLRSVPAAEGEAGQPRDGWGEPAEDALVLRGRARGASQNGAELYLTNCATCHAADGSGADSGRPGGYPRLYGNSSLGGTSANNLIKVILQGVDRETDEAHAFMPGFAAQLSNEQIARLTNYLLAQFGNSAQADVDAQAVARLREEE